MGGFGSGNPLGLCKRNTVEDSLILDVNRLVADGVIRDGHHVAASVTWLDSFTGGPGSVVHLRADARQVSVGTLHLEYELNLDRRPLLYAVDLSTSELPWGGLRWWIHCPIARDGLMCSRRCTKLYLPKGGVQFGCRSCHDLTYRSCQESHKNRYISKLLASMAGLDADVVEHLLSPQTRKSTDPVTPEELDQLQAISDALRGRLRTADRIDL